MALMNSARASATFDSRQLTYLLYGGKEATERREAAFTRVEDALGLSDMNKLPSAYADLNHEGHYLEGLAFGKAIMDDEIQHRHGAFDYHSHKFALIIASPFGHNPLMFGPTLRLQTSPEQRDYWVPLVEAGKIIGTYAQTELGHGTFLRGLETTATLDLDTDEFVVHSPTLTSTKYWPSALGFTASHAIVMANLIIRGKNHGMQPFMLQLRSLLDHSTLPGIETGDIGPKMGLNSTDMGYAIFTNVRIPRTHLLMGNVQVLRDGTFIKAKHQKMAYATMMYTRDRIVHNVAFQLAQAVVIATRYSTVREQGVGFSPTTSTPTTAEEKEWPIMAYKSQHYRLLSLMAQAYALFFAARECTALYTKLTADDDLTLLPFVHATTAALKAYATQVAHDGAEDARKCCGGFGYSVLSGLPSIVGDLAPMPTLEGENHVMYQQTARWLMKAINKLQAGLAVDEGVSYLSDAFTSSPTTTEPPKKCPASGLEFLHPETQLQIFRHRASRLAFHAHDCLTKAVEDKVPYAEAWNTNMLPLIHAARAHIELFVLEAFIAHTSSPPTTSPSPPTTPSKPLPPTTSPSPTTPSFPPALPPLLTLFALTTIENPLSPGSIHFFEDAYLSLSQLHDIRTLVGGLLEELRRDTIALGDGWGFSDASLGSAIGCADGDVYRRVMGWTRGLPGNLRDGGRGRWEGGVVRGRL
ncbi:MAG: hypothetical protein Q9195_005830 [Heterodermia aff. obscurata]